MKVWVMISTAGSLREAERIAETLVKEKLAACVTVLPGARSFYYWEGKMSRGRETVILAKTTGGNTSKIMSKINKIHSYQVPEILFLETARGEKRYAEWVGKSTTRK
jgi:periplasmic divalent cation tolerance protein